MTEKSKPADGQHYWESVRTLGFALPKCMDCEHFHFYLRPACPSCGGLNLVPTITSGRGQVYSFSIVHRAPSASFAQEVPYVVAIIATNEGPHLMTRLVNVAPDKVTIGMPVVVKDWRTQGDPPTHLSNGIAPPLFEPAAV